MYLFKRLSFTLLMFLTFSFWGKAQNQIDSLTKDSFEENPLFEQMFKMLEEFSPSLESMPNEDFEGFGNMEEMMNRLRPMMDQLPEMLDESNSFFFFDQSPSDMWGEMPMDMMNMDSLLGNINEIFPDLDQLFGNFQDNFNLPDTFGQFGQSWQDPKAVDRVIKEMEEEGLINEGERSKIELSESELIINGQKQTESTRKKYTDLYQKELTEELPENFNLRFHSENLKPMKKKKSKLKSRKI